MNLTLTRRRNAAAPAPGRGELARTTAIDAVDAALRQVGRRRRFIRSEVSGILADVRDRVDEAELGTATTAALDAAVAGLGTDAVVDGRCVVDALLDIRTTLAPAI
jgi:hypothetical protein